MSELIRTGTVSKFDSSSNTARVYFPEIDGEVTAPLRLIDTGAATPIDGEEVLCIFLSDSPDEGFILKIKR